MVATRVNQFVVGGVLVVVSDEFVILVAVTQREKLLEPVIQFPDVETDNREVLKDEYVGRCR